MRSVSSLGYAGVFGLPVCAWNAVTLAVTVSRMFAITESALKLLELSGLPAVPVCLGLNL